MLVEGCISEVSCTTARWAGGVCGSQVSYVAIAALDGL